MTELIELLVGCPRPKAWTKPNIYDPKNNDDAAAMAQLLRSGQVYEVVDEIARSIDELYDIDFPDQKDRRDATTYDRYVNELGSLAEYGRWVYFPWLHQLVHFPEAEHLRRLLTSRNRNLIKEDEQRSLQQAKVVVVGLSVGSNIAESILQQGLAGTFILIDKDVLDPTNLNRIRGGFADVGQHKVDLIAKKISQLNPYIEQVHYKDGLTSANLEEILVTHRPAAVVDEMDDLLLKIKLRQMCRDYQIPVLMATDDGDDILIDIERYDQEDNLPILHGRIPDEVIDEVLSSGRLSRQQAGVIIGKYFVGADNVPLRMIESLFEVGKTLPSWPQLGGATALAGVVTAYCFKRIALGQSLRHGRYLIGPDSLLNLDYQDSQYMENLLHLRQILDKGPAQ